MSPVMLHRKQREQQIQDFIYVWYTEKAHDVSWPILIIGDALQWQLDAFKNTFFMEPLHSYKVHNIANYQTKISM